MGTLITPGGHSCGEIQVTAAGDGLEEDGKGAGAGRGEDEEGRWNGRLGQAGLCVGGKREMCDGGRKGGGTEGKQGQAKGEGRGSV